LLNSQRNPTELLMDQNMLEDVNNDDSEYVVNINKNINLIDSNRNMMNKSTLNINYATNNHNNNHNNNNTNHNNNHNSNTNNPNITNHQNPKLRKSKFDIYLPNI